jgi:glyoxylase-like metal-dependent hydrolase (beta-lactamase superfamily II)
MACCCACSALAGAQAPQVVQLRPDIYMITVSGTNTVVQTGPEGTVVVVAGPARDAEALVAAIRTVATTPIHFVIATSADEAVAGGTGIVARAGESLLNNSTQKSATIVARAEVVPALLASAGKAGPDWFPNDAFGRSQYNFWLNGQGVAVMWQPAAHSDGDVAVRFWRSDVVVAGAIFDLTRFPVIDTAHGGSIDGEIDAINRLLNTQVISPVPLVTTEGGTIVVPIRGPAADQWDLLTYRDMLQDVRRRVQEQVAQRRTLEQVLQSDVVVGYARRFGAEGGDWTTRQFVTAVYQGLVTGKKRR